MSQNATEIVVGGAVLAAAAAFTIYLAQSAGVATGGGDSYELRASFRSVEGVSVGTDVRLGGVKIGSVTGLSLNPATYRADARFTVQSDIAVPDDSSVAITSEGLLGGNYVELIPGGSPLNLEPGQEIEDTQGAVSLIALLLKFVSGQGQ